MNDVLRSETVFKVLEVIAQPRRASWAIVGRRFLGHPIAFGL